MPDRGATGGLGLISVYPDYFGAETQYGRRLCKRPQSWTLNYGGTVITGFTTRRQAVAEGNRRLVLEYGIN